MDALTEMARMDALGKPSVEESLASIAASLATLAAAASTLTVPQTPPNLKTLNSLNLNSSDQEIKSSEEGMQGGKQTVSRAKRARAALCLLPKDFQFDDRAMTLGKGLGFTEQQVWQYFNQFKDYWDAEGRMKANWQAAFRNWLRKARTDMGGKR